MFIHKSAFSGLPLAVCQADNEDQTASSLDRQPVQFFERIPRVTIRMMKHAIMARGRYTETTELLSGLPHLTLAHESY